MDPVFVVVIGVVALLVLRPVLAGAHARRFRKKHGRPPRRGDVSPFLWYGVISGVGIGAASDKGHGGPHDGSPGSGPGDFGGGPGGGDAGGGGGPV